MNVHRSSSVSLKEETISTAAAKSALPVGVSGGLLFGMPISEVVQWITLIFLVAQIGLIVPKYWAVIKKWRDGK